MAFPDWRNRLTSMAAIAILLGRGKRVNKLRRVHRSGRQLASVSFGR